jgi:hypothetical protein
MAPKRRPAARKRKTKPASPRSPTPPPPSPETPNPAELPPPEANPPTVGIEYPEQQLSDTDNVDTAGSNFASDEDDLIATATTSAAVSEICLFNVFENHLYKAHKKCMSFIDRYLVKLAIEELHFIQINHQNTIHAKKICII